MKRSTTLKDKQTKLNNKKRNLLGWFQNKFWIFVFIKGRVWTFRISVFF
jgi:hypothetical protein